MRRHSPEEQRETWVDPKGSLALQHIAEERDRAAYHPGPLTPMPPRNFSKWAHILVSLGSMSWSCASSTCIFASLDLARVAKMSRISSARSITRCPVASSMFFPCDGLSSSSKTISDASFSSIASRSSSTSKGSLRREVCLS